MRRAACICALALTGARRIARSSVVWDFAKAGADSASAAPAVASAAVVVVLMITSLGARGAPSLSVQAAASVRLAQEAWTRTLAAAIERAFVRTRTTSIRAR